MNNILSIEKIKKIYTANEGNITAIEDISLNIEEGEIIGIVGKSGCGKSTLLNIISGLDKPTSGDIKYFKSAARISYMLQNDALLPWRSVLDNACLGLEIRKEKTEDEITRVKGLLSEYGLSDFIDEKPSSLSGGMKQRVALIRSLAIKPDILLLDEPFSALDYYTRINISEDVHEMIKKFGTTTIIITHDIQEALSFADKIVVLNSRPSTVKSVYDVPFKDGESILEKRKNPLFTEMYEKIWRDLDV